MTNIHFNIVVSLEITPRPETDAVRTALAQLQARHPILRSRIENNGGYQFVFDVRVPIPFPVEEIRLDDLSGWTRIAEEKLNRRLNAAEGPLMGCTILSDNTPENGIQIFSFHHAILDGQSAVGFMDVFLRVLGGEVEKVLPESTMIPQIGRILQPAFRGIRGLPAKAGFLIRTFTGEIAYRLRGLRTPDLPLQKNANCPILNLEFNKEETERIIRNARQANITLNSLINTALAVATSRTLYPAGRRQVRMLIFADLRPYVSPPLGPDRLGSAISMVQISPILPENMGAWEFASQVQAELLKAFRRGDKFFNFLMSDSLIGMVIRMNRERLGTCAMSYTGPLSLPERVGRFELRGVNTYISNNRLGPVLAGQARLFRKKLEINLLYLDTDMPQARAAAIRDGIREALLQQG